MENKVLRIDDLTERQFSLARRRRKEEDYVGALNVLRTILENNKNNTAAIKEIADVYMELDLMMLAVEYWFKFLKYCDEDDVAIGYNGLGTCFYLVDELTLAGYYYDLFFSIAANSTEFDYIDERLDFCDTISESEEPEFSVVYPLSKVPAEKRIAIAETKFFEGKEKETLKILKSIEKSDESYLDAQLRIAAYHLVKGRIPTAKRVVNGLIRDFPNDPLPLINKLVIEAESGTYDDAKRVFSMIESFDITESPQCGKIASSCVNAMLDEGAEKYAQRAVRDEPYSINALFTLGAAKYNLKKFDEARDAFIKVYQITDSKIAKYYADQCLNPDKRGAPKRMGCEIRYPQSVRKNYLKKVLKYVNKFPKVTARNLGTILDVCDWIYSFKNTLQAIFAKECVMSGNAELQDYFIELLLCDVDDSVKYAIVEALILCGRKDKLSVVYNSIYSEITLLPLDVLWNDKTDVWMRAYAVAFSRMSAFYKVDLMKIRDAAVETLSALFNNGNLSLITDVDAFAVAMVVLSGIQQSKQLSLICSYFFTDTETTNQILQLIKAGNVDN